MKELSPRELHSYTGGLIMLQIALGQLVANMLGLMVPGYPDDSSSKVQNTETWRIIFGISIGISVLFGALLFIVPESPKFLYMRGKRSNCEEVLASLYNVERSVDQMREIESEQRDTTESDVQVSYKELFNNHRITLGTGLCILIDIYIYI